jgi:hypothetical protein
MVFSMNRDRNYPAIHVTEITFLSVPSFRRKASQKNQEMNSFKIV